MLNYFNSISKKFAPTTLWSIYFMLKLTFTIENNIDISKYSELQSLLRKVRVGYISKKAEVNCIRFKKIFK